MHTHHPSRVLGRALLSAAAALLSGAGCSVFDPGDDVCTLAGCFSGLRVELAARPTGPFRVEVTSAAAPGGATYVFDCPDAARCGPGAFFPDFTPERVTVRVVTSGGAVTRDFAPAYRTFRPNGDDCEPTCREATVRVEA
jgi:hypothetical protein